MALFGKKKQLEQENQRLRDMMTPEMKEAESIDQRLSDLRAELASIETSITKKRAELAKVNNELTSAENDLVITNEAILMQEFGLYEPKFSFMTADEYKNQLDLIRDREKTMVKNGIAASGAMDWQVNGDGRKGAKMVNDTKKLLLRAFNVECDEVINKVKYNNIEASEKRIRKAAETISKLGTVMQISISWEYLDAKIQELYLAFEYAQKKQEEKEAIREAKAAAREEAKLQKEIEEQRKLIEKEQTHYEQALAKILKQLESGDDPDLLQKKKELEDHLGIIDAKIKDLDYREANKRAGYVYIISNIGSFGENVYKIGMTRRLDPQDRIDELGDASVPFNFDVHAMIFSDDAPSLEAALHRAFESRKLNMVNQRREFFAVTLDEIKAVVKANFDKTVEFYEIPDAEQYRESLKIKAAMNK